MDQRRKTRQCARNDETNIPAVSSIFAFDRSVNTQMKMPKNLRVAVLLIVAVNLRGQQTPAPGSRYPQGELPDLS